MTIFLAPGIECVRLLLKGKLNIFAGGQEMAKGTVWFKTALLVSLVVLTGCGPAAFPPI
jgi:hypothetical protein